MILKKLMHYLFGWQYVLLHDYDGQITVARAYRVGQYWMADRYGHGIRTVVLLQAGRLRNGGYVESWEPLTNGIDVSGAFNGAK